MITLNVNGQKHDRDVPPDMPLLWVLRDVVGLTGTKSPGGIGEPGTAALAAALTNAIFAATGKRLRTLPVGQQLRSA